MPEQMSDHGQGRPKGSALRWPFALFAGGVIALAAGVGAAAGSGVKLEFKQSVTSVHMKAVGLSQLSGSGAATELCWRLVGKGGEHKWCATRKRVGATWRLTGAHKGASIRIDGSSALLALKPATAKIDPGRWRWSFAVVACAKPPVDPSGATGATGEQPCAVRHPASGGRLVQIHGLIAKSCSVRGARQVSKGPQKVRRVALTFDDGPAAITPRFLKTLRQLKIPATFFMIGEQVPGRSALLKQMLREGHELGNHSWNHANLGRGGAAATRQITRTNAAIRHASGFQPCLMRPPYGASSPDLARRVRAEGMTSVLWNVDPLDWRKPGSGRLVSVISSHTHAGSIILEHDGGGMREQTLAAIPRYVHTLKQRGYKFVTVSELLGNRTSWRLDR